MINVVQVDYKSPLSDKYVYDILTLVLSEGRIKASDLRRVCCNYETVKKAAEALVVNGLLCTYTDRGPRLKIIYETTVKGRRIAELLMQARYIFYGETYVDGVIPPKEGADREDP